MENLTAEITTTASAPPTLPRDTTSYRKFLEWNGEEGWFEWVDGEVIKMSNPSLRHQDLSDFLTAILRFFIEAKNYGKVISAPFQIKFDFRPSGRQPDIMFVSNENLHRLEKQYVDGKADLIVEIVSPESLARDTQEKFLEYEMAGIGEYWLIDPNTRTAIFYGFDDTGKYKMLPISADGVFESRVIENLWIDTNWLWQETLPNLMDILKEWKLV
ncbi:MAG: Uma2 family endonuclease [Pyrinomonadaceae bacterium]